MFHARHSIPRVIEGVNVPDEDDDKIEYGEIVEGSFKPVMLNEDEAALMGEATWGLINASLNLRNFVVLEAGKTADDYTEQERAIGTVIGWAEILLKNIEAQSAKAGLGFMP